MPDANGRIPPVSVPRVWPGHRDYEPRPIRDLVFYPGTLEFTKQILDEAQGNRRVLGDSAPLPSGVRLKLIPVDLVIERVREIGQELRDQPDFGAGPHYYGGLRDMEDAIIEWLEESEIARRTTNADR